jgi:hypothetical protein
LRRLDITVREVPSGQLKFFVVINYDGTPPLSRNDLIPLLKPGLDRTTHIILQNLGSISDLIPLL